MKKYLIMVVMALVCLTTNAQWVKKLTNVVKPKTQQQSAVENMSTEEFKLYDFSIPFSQYVSLTAGNGQSDQLFSIYKFITKDGKDMSRCKWNTVNTTDGIMFYTNFDGNRYELGAGSCDVIPTAILDSLTNRMKGKTYIYQFIKNMFIGKSTKFKLTCQGVALTEDYSYPNRSNGLYLCAIFDDGIAVPLNGVQIPDIENRILNELSNGSVTGRMVLYKSEYDKLVIYSKKVLIRPEGNDVFGSATEKVMSGDIKVGMTEMMIKSLLNAYSGNKIRGEGYVDGTDPYIYEVSEKGRHVVVEMSPNGKVTKILRDAVYSPVNY